MTMRSLLVLLLLAIPLSARADDPKAEAKQHIDRASTLHKDGRFAEALDELKTAYALDPQPQLLFAMGQIHVSLGQCPKAITYYERFLTTKPPADVAAMANEAIAACKTNPPPAVTVEPKAEPKLEPVPEPKAEPIPEPKHEVAARHEPTEVTSRPWYGDYFADGLVLGGLVSAGVGIVMFDRARADRDAADHATTFGGYTDLIDRAHTKQTYAIGLGALGGAAVTAGALHFLFTRHVDRGIAISTTRGGGTITWTRPF
jgi:tetratricopeptide (TPR) repeat protein